MSITIIHKTEHNELLKFKTEELYEDKDNTGNLKSSLYLKVTSCDMTLKDTSKPNLFELMLSEKEFHINLRLQAAKAKELITSHSTDPEWNPENYIKNLE